MKRKVKKYADGDVVTSRGGATNMRTRSADEIAEDNKSPFGRYSTKSVKSEVQEERPTTSGVEDYASMGKRAGATSPFSGPKEYISESIKEDTENKGIASGFKSGESKFERKDNEVKMPVVRKKISETKPKKEKPPTPYTDVVKKEELGETRQYESRSSDPKKEYYRDFSGKLKEKTPDSNPKKSFGDSISEGIKSFGSSLSDYASKNIKSPAQRRDEEKASKGYAKGGKVSSASSRGDGIAQRGKTRGKMC